MFIIDIYFLTRLNIDMNDRWITNRVSIYSTVDYSYLHSTHIGSSDVAIFISRKIYALRRTLLIPRLAPSQARYHNRGVCSEVSQIRITTLKTDRRFVFATGVRHTFSLSCRRQALRPEKRGKIPQPKNAAVVNPLAKQFLIGVAKRMKLEEKLTPATRIVPCRYKKIICLPNALEK